MANLSNINNKLLVGTNGEVRIGDTATVANVKLRVKQTAQQWTAQFINTDSSVAYGISIDTSASSYGVAGTLQCYTNSGGGFIVRNDSKVGIGTASPSTFLQVSGQGNRAGGNIQMGLSSEGANKWSYLTGTHYNSTTEPEGFALIGGYSSINGESIIENKVVIGGDIWETNPATSIHFWTHSSSTHAQGGSQRMVINSGGDVLIGNTVVNPASGFSNQKGIGYNSATGQAQIASTSDVATLVLGRNNSTDGSLLEFRKESTIIGNFGSNTTGGQVLLDLKANQNFRIVTNNSERMRINSSGNVSFLSQNVDVKGPSAGNTQIRIADSTGTIGSNSFDLINDGTAAYVWNRKQTDLNFATYGSLRMKIRASGTVGIGANGGYDSQMLSIDAGVLDGAIYATSSDANCFASFRDGNSNVNVEYGAVGNDHVLRKDAAQYFVVNNVGDVYNYQSVNKANTYYGYDAGNYDGTGGSNTAMGYEAGGALTTGTQNVCIGRNAGDKLTTGINNTSIGTNSGFSNVDGAQNTYIGAAAGYTSPGQNYNTFVGREAGYFNVANENTAVGRNAMHANTSGLRNVSLGFNSLSSNQTGNGNTALGYKALTSSTSNYNVGIGDRALAQLTTGASNIAIGTESGFLETTGSSQIFIGFRAGYNINNATTASGENVIIGHQAAINRTGGTENVFIGSLANYIGVGTGSNNVVVGRYAGAKMTSATRCTFLGHQAGAEVTTGPNNTFIGKGAGDSTTTGSNNTHVGQAAGDEASTGDYNICIGHGSGSGSSPFQLTTQSGRVVIGDNSITNAYTRVSWTVTSDKRDKTDFGDVPHGLDFVSKLKPISYKFRKDRDSEETQGSKRYGFLAQEVLQLEGENPVIIDNTDEDKLSYTESNLVPVLVKAIQELKAEIELLKSK
jgi:hypothetical protein